MIQPSVEDPATFLDPHTLSVIRQVGMMKTYPADTLLTRQGEIEDTFYVLDSGNVIVVRLAEDGEEQMLATLGPRQSFGEMALIDDKPRLATIKTLTESTVLEMTADQFRDLLRHDPDLALHITRRVLANLRRLDQVAIQDLREKNELLHQAYLELQAAQLVLVEKKRLEREMELAAEMQRNLLPAALPSFEDYRFYSYLAPARHVGGDLFDVRPIDEENVAILIADVADKGVHAALLMAVTRTLFFQEAVRSLSPREVVYAVHSALLSIGGGNLEGYGMDAFVTAFYAVLNRPSGKLTYVRAAQDRPLWIRAGARPEPLEGNGRFLGMIDGLELQEHQIMLQPGDNLLLYSDGVTDQMNEADESYGVERLKAAFQAAVGESDGNQLLFIVKDIDNWRGRAPAFDDLTMLLVQAIDRSS